MKIRRGEMKVLIQSLGEVPATIEFALEEEKPDITYIICSDYQLKEVARGAKYETSNETVITKVAKKTGTKVVFKLCDTLEPKSISKAIGEVIEQIKPSDDVTINYTGGTAGVKLILGATAVVLSRILPIRIIYSVKYKGGIQIFKDQTKELREIFQQLYNFF
jgi:hypothetical protein